MEECLSQHDKRRLGTNSLKATRWRCPWAFNEDYNKKSENCDQFPGYQNIVVDETPERMFDCFLQNDMWRKRFLCGRELINYSEEEKFKCCIGETSVLNCHPDLCPNKTWCKNYLNLACLDINRLNKEVCRNIAIENSINNSNYDSLVKKWCEKSENRNNKFCSCLKPLTTYNGNIEYYKEILNNPICFSNDCKTFGYQTFNQRKDQCPKEIQICDQSINIGNKSNIELSNMINQCQQNINLNSTNNNNDNNNKDINDNKDINNNINFKKILDFIYNNWIILLIIILIFPLGLYFIIEFISNKQINN
jgi:hypothetical protein